MPDPPASHPSSHALAGCTAAPIVLGSRSPRRRELLSLLVPAEEILVVPPADSGEQGFDDTTSWAEIRGRLREITRSKAEDVGRQLEQARSGTGGTARLSGIIAKAVCVVCADTVIVANPALRADCSAREPGRAWNREAGQRVVDDAGRLQAGCPDRWTVLGQPPEDSTAEATLREWFAEFLAGRTHVAATAVCLIDAAGRWHEGLTCTEVDFHDDATSRLEWYLGTGEFRGKAGGYAIQGAGSVFVSQVRGSLSNVIGLPLESLRDLLVAGGGSAG